MKSRSRGLPAETEMLPVLLLEPDLDLRSAIVSALVRAHVSCDIAATPAGALLKIRGNYSKHRRRRRFRHRHEAARRCVRARSRAAGEGLVISGGGETPAVMNEQPVLLKPFDARSSWRR
jgi:hypothetical protein